MHHLLASTDKGLLGTFGLFIGEQSTGVVNDMWMAGSQQHGSCTGSLQQNIVVSNVTSNTCVWQIHIFSERKACPVQLWKQRGMMQFGLLGGT